MIQRRRVRNGEVLGEHVIGPSIAYIPLSKGSFACIDSDLLNSIGKHPWTEDVSPWGAHYGRIFFRNNGQLKSMKLHRQIMNAPSGVPVDHINGNTLDNRRANLRLTTTYENSLNVRSFKNSISKYVGVCPYGKSGYKWKAYLDVNGERFAQHGFTSEREAAACRKVFEIMSGVTIFRDFLSLKDFSESELNAAKDFLAANNFKRLPKKSRKELA